MNEHLPVVAALKTSSVARSAASKAWSTKNGAWNNEVY